MGNYGLLILLFCAALGLAVLFTPLMIKLAHKLQILSMPGRRRIHTKPVPFLGSLAVYLSFFISLFIAFNAYPQTKISFSHEIQGLFIAGTLIVLLGLWDDIKNIKPLIKLTGQISAALILFYFGFRIEVFTNPLTGAETQIHLIFSVLFTVAWVVGLMNAMNLIDGLDGLAAGLSAIVCFTLLLIALHLDNFVTAIILAILAGSALGFLKYNFHPAKIFLGDSGSMFLGLVLAATILIKSQYKSAAAVVLLAPLTALSIPIYDTFMAIVRRTLKKGSIFIADKKHLHHRLLEFGLTQRQIVFAVYLVTLYLGMLSFLFVLLPNRYALILLFLLALGFFMGVRLIGFIERKIKLIHKLEAQHKEK
jgi:UDP-GlcNAc:undecaprenyl-phosphate GlcNAc-1-phosphate transferase